MTHYTSTELLVFALAGILTPTEMNKETRTEDMGREPLTKKSTSYFIDASLAPKIAQMQGVHTSILTGLQGEKMMMVITTTEPNHSLPQHSHPNEQIGMVLAGRARVRIGKQERIMKKGDFCRIPANVAHGGVCLGQKPFVMLDIFCRVRGDFLEKAKQQRRR